MADDDQIRALLQAAYPDPRDQFHDPAIDTRGYQPMPTLPSLPDNRPSLTKEYSRPGSATLPAERGAAEGLYGMARAPYDTGAFGANAFLDARYGNYGSAAQNTLAALAALPIIPGAKRGLVMDPARAAELGLDKPWYHGSNRVDRLVEKGEINPKRATSGPMPFFTDDPDIASNYAKNKPDTSRMAEDPGDSVAPYFTVSPKDLGRTRERTPYTVEQSWYALTPEQRAAILVVSHFEKFGSPGRFLALYPPFFGGRASVP